MDSEFLAFCLCFGVFETDCDSERGKFANSETKEGRALNWRRLEARTGTGGTGVVRRRLRSHINAADITKRLAAPGDITDHAASSWQIRSWLQLITIGVIQLACGG